MTNTKVLTDALQKIAEWELPATGKFWDEEKKEPMSYGAAYGSNGERDYMKKIASAALASYAAPQEKPKVSGFEHAIMTVADPEGAKNYQPYTREEENKMREDKIRAQAARMKIQMPEGQVTGKSAVWVNIDPSTDPKESKVYNVKKNREGREIIGECMYDNLLGEWNGDWDQWLDTSGEAGKQPNSTNLLIDALDRIAYPGRWSNGEIITVDSLMSIATNALKILREGKQPEQLPADLRKFVDHVVKQVQSYVSDHTYTNLQHETYDGMEPSDYISQYWDTWIAEFFPGSAQSDVSGEQRTRILSLIADIEKRIPFHLNPYNLGDSGETVKLLTELFREIKKGGSHD